VTKFFCGKLRSPFEWRARRVNQSLVICMRSNALSATQPHGERGRNRKEVTKRRTSNAEVGGFESLPRNLNEDSSMDELPYPYND